MFGTSFSKQFAKGWYRVRLALTRRVPAYLRDPLALRQYEEVSALVPVLYFTIAVINVAAGLTADDQSNIFYRLILPSFLMLVSVWRFSMWRSRRGIIVTAAIARKRLFGTFIAALVLNLLGGLWTASAFLMTPGPYQAIVPIFMILSSFATANCLSSLPRTAIVSVFSGLTPVSIAMMLSSDIGVQAMAACIVMTSILQIHLVLSKFDQTIIELGLQHELQRQADTDALTGLSNRRAFNALLASQTALADENNFAVAMIDLDGFKSANDAHGHGVGDEILIEVARRLNSICRDAQCVARLGGDEFAIIFAQGSVADIIDEYAEAIRVILSLPFAVSLHVAGLGASVGIARFPENASNPSGLLKAADIALYADKGERKGKAAHAA